jgi:hypothetical protein
MSSCFVGALRRRHSATKSTRTLLKDTRRLGDEELSRLAKAQENDLLWLGDQITEATKVFGRYIGFAHVK